MKKAIPVELTLSISAMIIAIASIAISIWEGIIMRNHYHLSIQPQLNYSFEASYNHNDTHMAYYEIKNNGLGPAVITDIKYFIDKKIVDIDYATESSSNIVFDVSCLSVIKLGFAT